MSARLDDAASAVRYLNALIRWLSFTPGPPSASVPQRLRVVDVQTQDAEDLDADELARHCERLLVLGEPGSGKTWLARRTARLQAEAALTALSEGTSPDQVELPLYSTCSRLVSAPGDMCQAAASSTLGQLPGTAGSRAAALATLLARKDAPRLLVIDALDELSVPDHRLDHAAWLPLRWRVMLTSRPTAWKYPIGIDERGRSNLIAMLQPLRYPADVEAFIADWFRQRPEQGDRLAAQLAERAALRHAARVPLFLTFCCLLGGDRPLPGRPCDLRAEVVRRMLADGAVGVAALRDWAWSGATENVGSGVGTWLSEIPAPRFVHRSIREHLVAEHVALRMSADEAAGELLKHLWYDPDWEYTGPAALVMHPQRDKVLNDLAGCIPSRDLALADGTTMFRQFLARLAAESGEHDWSRQSARMIGRGRWDVDRPRDPEWLRQLGPGWPTSDGQLLHALIKELRDATDSWTAAGLAETMAQLDASEQDLAAARSALLGLLSRETRPWMARLLAEAISGLQPGEDDRRAAREALIMLLSGPGIRPGTALELADTAAELKLSAWDRTRIRSALIDLLTGLLRPRMSRALAEALARLEPPQPVLAAARSALLARLARESDPRTAQDLAEAVAALGATGPEMAAARSTLLELLRDESHPTTARLLAKAVRGLGATGPDQAVARAALIRMLRAESRPRIARELAEAVAGLEPSGPDLAAARSALLALLARESDPRTARELVQSVSGLDPAGSERAAALETLLGLASQASSWERARQLTAAVRLAVTPQDRAQVGQALLAEVSGLVDPTVAAELGEAVIELDMAEGDLARGNWAVMREALSRHIASQRNPWAAKGLATAMTRLPVTPHDRMQVREALLGQLSGLDDLSLALALAEAVAGLDPTEDDRARVWVVLHSLVAGPVDGETIHKFAVALTRLAPPARERAPVRTALLDLLSREIHVRTARALAGALPELEPSEQDRARARMALLKLMSRETDAPEAIGLAEAVARLDLEGQDTARGLDVLLRLLSRGAFSLSPADLTEAVPALAGSELERAKIRKTFLELMSRTTYAWSATMLSQALARLDPTERELARTRAALLSQLAREPFPEAAEELADTLARLGPTAQDQAQAREALVQILAQQAVDHRARPLMRALALLQPTIEDLAGWPGWAAPPSSRLLAAVRRNSPLAAWVAALPSLTQPPQAADG